MDAYNIISLVLIISALPIYSRLGEVSKVAELLNTCERSLSNYRKMAKNLTNYKGDLVKLDTTPSKITFGTYFKLFFKLPYENEVCAEVAEMYRHGELVQHELDRYNLEQGRIGANLWVMYADTHLAQLNAARNQVQYLTSTYPGLNRIKATRD